jgi:molybdopterin-guanine dinucleotide biosynthesis protein B
VQAEPTAHQLIAELYDCDWVLVEGFKHADLLKIEVWRAEAGKPVQYPNDPFVVAVCTDSPEHLPAPTGLPLLDLNDPDGVAQFLLGHPERYEYRSPLFEPEPPAHADLGAGPGPADRRDPPAG